MRGVDVLPSVDVLIIIMVGIMFSIADHET
jgi:hypothetical protein